MDRERAAAALGRLAEATSPDKDARLAPWQRRVARTARTMWRQQARLLLAELADQAWRWAGLTEAGPIPDRELDRIWDAVTAATSGPLENTLDQLAPRALTAGADDTNTELGLTVRFDLDHPDAVRYMATFGARRVADINRTTLRQMRTILTDAAATGRSYQATARQIRARFDGFSTPSPLRHIKDRAELVAVTELGDAYEHGAWMSRQQAVEAGEQVEVSWDGENDAAMCEMCAANAAAGWIPHDFGFPSGSTRAPEHPGCRCAVLNRIVTPIPALT